MVIYLEPTADTDATKNPVEQVETKTPEDDPESFTDSPQAGDEVVDGSQDRTITIEPYSGPGSPLVAGILRDANDPDWGRTYLAGEQIELAATKGKE